MNRARIRAELERMEGRVDEPYRDHLGNWTIGVGHLIQHLELSTLMPHRTLGEALTSLCRPEQIERWFEQDIAQAENDARRFVYTFDTLTDARREVLVNMAFQLGATRLGQFVKFRAAILAEHWVEASEEMLRSRWAEQTPGRAQYLADKFLEG